MTIHANAPLGPKGRATMVRRVLEEGIAFTEASRSPTPSPAGPWESAISAPALADHGRELQGNDVTGIYS